MSDKPDHCPQCRATEGHQMDCTHEARRRRKPIDLTAEQDRAVATALWASVEPAPDLEAPPLDLAAIEHDHPGALMGCVLLNKLHNHSPPIDLFIVLAAHGAGLVTLTDGIITPTPTGDRVLAALRALVRGMSPDVLRIALATRDSGKANHSAAVCAALALHGRERDQ